jgi:hypothetical protein
MTTLVSLVSVVFCSFTSNLIVANVMAVYFYLSNLLKSELPARLARQLDMAGRTACIRYTDAHFGREEISCERDGIHSTFLSHRLFAVAGMAYQ